MKKLLKLTLAALIMFGTVGCTTQNDDNASQGNDTNESINDGESEVEMTINFGEVSQIVGNEITVSIGKNDLFGNSGAVGEDSLVEQGDDASEEAPAIGMVPPIMGDAEAPVGESGLGEALDIEYTGETLDITIPAGTQITNMFGEEIDFSSLEKGSLIEVYINSETSIVEKVILWQ